MANNDLDNFYNSLQTVPKLISDLALGIAEAQRRMDHDYLENLAEFFRLVSSLQGSGSTPAASSADQFLALFRAMAPSRYQFTETVVEVRADLQMSSMSETSVGVNVGIKAAVFAVAVNASYTKRNAYDSTASAVIRTTLHAVPAEPGMLDKLLPRAGDPPKATGPQTQRYKDLAEAFKTLMQIAPANAGSLPAGSLPPGSIPGSVPRSTP
jgi:hypothetical protein